MADRSVELVIPDDRSRWTRSRRPGLRDVGALVLVFTVGCTSGNAPGTAVTPGLAATPVSSASTPASAQQQLPIDYAEYVKVALDAMEAYHWNSEAVNWQEVRHEASDDLSADPSPAEAYAALSRAVRAFDTLHSAFIPPGAQRGDSDTPQELPMGDRIGDIAYVTVPSIGGGDVVHLRAYLRAAHDALEDADTPDPACGWIVDLRDNTGGNLEPMLHAVRGLLGEGRVLSASSRLADSWVEIGASGAVEFGHEEGSLGVLESPLIERQRFPEEIAQERQDIFEAYLPYLPVHGDRPMAILTSNRTASSGEVMVIAFSGRPHTRTIGGITFGVPTGVVGFRMADGAILSLAVSTFSDRDGVSYTGNLVPDSIIADTGGSGEGAILSAAIDWLESMPDCG
jgi:carboxyl-terminal processing protease